MAIDPKLSIILVNFNGKTFIQRCLDSIFDSQTSFAYEVILIDNASQDQSKPILKQYEDRCRLFFNETNLGFSKANNQGIRLAKGHYVLLLNTDTILYPDALEKMLLYYEAHPKIGALSPKLLNPDGSVQTQGSSFGFWRFRAKKPRKIPFISGASLMTTKAIMAEIGGLDEQLFFYNDDIDFCKQMAKRNYPIMYVPDALVIHFGGLSSKSREAASIVDGYRGSLYLCRKFYPKVVYSIYKTLVLVEVVLKNLVYRVLSVIQAKRYKAFVEAYRNILYILIKGED